MSNCNDAALENMFTDLEWDEAKMFGQYEQRTEGEVVVFRRVDLAAYVGMIRVCEAMLATSLEQEMMQ
jgi:hypothetical protein